MLTKADLNTIAYALCCAIAERDSFADAYSRTGPEAERAQKNIDKFEKLHVKIFGQPSAWARDKARWAAAPTVNIFEIEGR